MIRRKPKTGSKTLGIAWPATSMLALGINFSCDDEIVYNKNFEQKLTKMKGLLNLWYPRTLTLCPSLRNLQCLEEKPIVTPLP